MPPKITSPATDQMMFSFGIETKIATSPKTISPSSAQNRTRYQDRSRRRVADRSEARYEPARGAGGLPYRGGIGPDIGAQNRAERQPEQSPAPTGA